IAFQKPSVAVEVVVGQADGHLLGVLDKGSNLNRKSELYLPGKRACAISFSVWVIRVAWSCRTQKTMVFPISPLSGSRSAFFKNVSQKTRLVSSEKNLFSKSLPKKVCSTNFPSSFSCMTE